MFKSAIAAAVVALALGGGVAGAFTSEGTGNERVCYPAAKWGPAPDGRRPCYTVARLYEDGSGRLLLGTAHKRQAVCIVPNVAEERGSFAIHCRRR